jgi:hypothetical protein
MSMRFKPATARLPRSGEVQRPRHDAEDPEDPEDPGGAGTRGIAKGGRAPRTCKNLPCSKVVLFSVLVFLVLLLLFFLLAGGGGRPHPGSAVLSEATPLLGGGLFPFGSGFDVVLSEATPSCAIAWRDDGRCDVNPATTTWPIEDQQIFWASGRIPGVRAGCDPDSEYFCCGESGYCGGTDIHCAPHSDTNEVLDFRRLVRDGSVPSRFVVPPESAHLVTGGLGAHAVLDEWLAPFVFNDFEGRGALSVQGYDSRLDKRVRYSRPWDEIKATRPRCGAMFGNVRCRHARCCSPEGFCGDSEEYCTDLVLRRE